MLQSIRDKITGWVAALIIGAISIVFIFWGIGMRSATGTTYAAKVNGEKISLSTVQRAWQNRQAQLQEQFKAEIPESFKQAQQTALLEEFIRSHLLLQRAQTLGLVVADKRVFEALSGIEALQVDGEFSATRYKEVLAQQGLSRTEVERQIRDELTVEQLKNGLRSTAFVTPKELERRVALEQEQREVDYAIVTASTFASGAVVTPEEIKAWYEAHSEEYRTTETVDLQYIDLRLTDFSPKVTVSDATLQTYYEQNKHHYGTAERRHARHILLKVEKVADDAAVRTQAEELIKQINAGADFAATAKQYSKDPGSAAQGGDLGWATKGMFVAPFEAAIFSMAVNEVRGPVKTQFGYHIIKLEEIDAAHEKPFAAIRAEVEQAYREEQAQKLFYDQTQKLADEAFASLNELDSVAQSVGAPLHMLNGFTRQGGGELGNDPQIIDAAFSEQVLEKHENSALITIGEDRALVLRVVDHHAPQPRPLEQVRGEIEATLKNTAMRAAAEKWGQDALARLLSGTLKWNKLTTGTVKAAPVGKRFIDRRAAGIAPQILNLAFSVDRTTLGDSAQSPVYRGTVLDNGDYALLAVSAVRSGTMDTNELLQRALRGAQTAGVGNAEMGAYVAELERTAKIERNPNVFQ